MFLPLHGAQPPAGMYVLLLLPLLFLHEVPLGAESGDNVVEENLRDSQSVTSRPTTLQNITIPQTSTEPQPIHRTDELCTNHTTPGPSPVSSPIEYIVYGYKGVCLKIKAIFMLMLNTTKLITFPSPPISQIWGICGYVVAYLSLHFPGGNYNLGFKQDERTFYLWHIDIRIQDEDGTEMKGQTPLLQAMETPFGQSIICDVMTLEVTPHLSVVLMDVMIQAFELGDDDLGGGDGLTYIFFDSWGRFRHSCKHWIVTRLVPSIYTAVFLVAFPLNTMAIVMFLKMKDRKPAVVYLLNLATADVLLVIVLPFYIVYRFLGSNWLIGDGMCRFVTAAFYCNMFCSVLLMTIISIDRFLALVYPMRSLSRRTVKLAWLVCGVTWVISLTSTVPLLLVKQTNSDLIPGMTTCHDAQHLRGYGDGTLHYDYFISVFTLYNFLPLAITTFCYIGIIRSLSRSPFGRTHKISRAIRLSVVVLCVFLLCFGPTNVIYLIHFKRMKNDDYSLYLPYALSSCISSINCCLDPLIYYFASSEYRSYVYSLLRCKKDYHPPIELKVIRAHRD